MYQEINSALYTKILRYLYRNFCKTALKKVFFVLIKNEKLLSVAISQ